MGGLPTDALQMGSPGCPTTPLAPLRPQLPAVNSAHGRRPLVVNAPPKPQTPPPPLA
jgi:hypothetical protein